MYDWETGEEDKEVKHEDKDKIIKDTMKDSDAKTKKYEKEGKQSMEGTEMLAAQLAAQRNNDNDGIGGGGLVTGLLLGTLVGRRGGLLGDGDGRDGHGCGCNKCCEKMIDMHDHHDDHNHEVDEIHGVQMEVCAAERQVADMAMMLQKCCCDTDKDVLESKSDTIMAVMQGKFDTAMAVKDCCCETTEAICDAKFALDHDIMESRFENALQGKDIIREIDLSTCKVERNIDSVKFNQEIIAKDAAMQLADCCCEIKEKVRDSIDATRCEAEKTRDLIRCNREKDLEAEIAELRFEKRSKENADNIIANFGTMITTLTNSLNSVTA